MALRKFNPTTPGQRHKVAFTSSEITASKPEKTPTPGPPKPPPGPPSYSLSAPLRLLTMSE